MLELVQESDTSMTNNIPIVYTLITHKNSHSESDVFTSQHAWILAHLSDYPVPRCILGSYPFVQMFSLRGGLHVSGDVCWPENTAT